MSVEAIAIALHHSRATGTAKLVLIGIANHDGDGGAWPAVDTLAKYAGVHRRNVQRALERLEQLGEIRRIIGAGGDHSIADHMKPNLYRMLLACPATCDHTRNHRTSRSLELAPFTELLTGVAVAPPPDASATGRGGGSATRTVPINQPLRQRREVVDLNARARELDLCEGCGRPFRSGTQHGRLCRDCRQEQRA